MLRAAGGYARVRAGDIRTSATTAATRITTTLAIRKVTAPRAVRAVRRALATDRRT